jgi:murein L,D-transpeptidase YcbB/YkuD
VSILDRASDASDAARALSAIDPPQPGYRALRAALQRYRELAQGGPWPPELGRRLALEGYDTTGGVEPAVRHFQQLHGLVVDGVVGPATRAALRISAADRAQQIALNLERWRWLPRALGERYIAVNSAAFTLELVERDSIAWTTRAIVGRTDWPTPILSARATSLLFRPRWKVPRIISARELLPLIQRDSTYLTRERFRVFNDSVPGGAAVDPHTVDWSQVTESTFTYQLIQEPGRDNPLGGVKLVFWNAFSVFIHDTPARPLFSEPLRTFSHGCVRIENAADLVARLLPDWSMPAIHAAMAEGRDRSVPLPQPINVHLVYWTAWSTSDGLVAFADDPYGWDTELARALEARRLKGIVS